MENLYKIVNHHQYYPSLHYSLKRKYIEYTPKLSISIFNKLEQSCTPEKKGYYKLIEKLTIEYFNAPFTAFLLENTITNNLVIMNPIGLLKLGEEQIELRRNVWTF